MGCMIGCIAVRGGEESNRQRNPCIVRVLNGDESNVLHNGRHLSLPKWEAIKWATKSLQYQDAKMGRNQIGYITCAVLGSPKGKESMGNPRRLMVP